MAAPGSIPGRGTISSYNFFLLRRKIMTKIKIIFVLVLLSQQLISSTAEEFFLGVKYNDASKKMKFTK